MSTYPQRLYDIGLTIKGQFTKAKDHHTLQCHVCEHEWEATPLSKLQAFKKYGRNGCPVCHYNRTNEILQVKRLNAINVIKSKGFDIVSEYDGKQTTTDTITVTRLECSHTFDSAPGNLLHNNVQCPVCCKTKKRQRFQRQNAKRRAIFLETATEWEKYKSSVSILSESEYNQHKSIINPNDSPRGLAGTPGAYQLDHIVPVRWCFDNDVPYSACADVSNLQFITWEQNLHKKNKLQLDYIPTSIQPYFHDMNNVGQCLFTIKKTLSDHGVVVVDDSDILIPYKIHLFIPSVNVAIRVYDIDNECEQQVVSTKIQANLLRVSTVKGIKLLQIFSDEWIHDDKLILSKVLHYCNIKTDRERVHGRKCIIKIIPNDIKNTFLNLFHIQGADRSQINVGAFHPSNPNRLIAVMSFCKPRVVMGQKKQTIGKWELSRFATDVECTIPGIASKLLTHFKRSTDWSDIYSYADRRWSVGNVYIKLGFTESKHNPPAYWYIVDGKRKHRWGFRKDAIRERFPEVYDKNKTEYAMMLEVGIDRIWDAGTILYSITNHKYTT